jgi:SAM-dependent methyltransferase
MYDWPMPPTDPATPDPYKFTNIAHSGLTYCNPVSQAKLEELFSLLPLDRESRVLDVGCGKCSMLIHLAARYGLTGVGVDPNRANLDIAREQATVEGVLDRLSLHEKRISDVDLATESFDAALCVGASHAYGDLATTLVALRELVRPGGYLLLGEGYWKAEPPPEYLVFMGMQASELGTHHSNVDRGLSTDLNLLHALVASDDDWDHYEGMYAGNIERYCHAHQDDPDCPAMLSRIRGWRDGYFRWGRTCLGFGLYLFQRP